MQSEKGYDTVIGEAGLRLSGGEKQRISIAHKLTSLRNAGQILVLENGHIAQCGTHGELIKEKGLYRKLWEESKN